MRATDDSTTYFARAISYKHKMFITKSEAWQEKAMYIQTAGKILLGDAHTVEY